MPTTLSWPLLPSSAPESADVWTRREDALWDWVKAGSGLPDAQVIWADQNAAQPPDPFITLRLSGPLTQLGAADAVVVEFDESAAQGQEMIHTVEGARELTVVVQAYSDATHGPRSGFALLASVQTAMALPSVRAGLHAGGLYPFDAGAIQNLSALEVTDFEGRASLAVRFYVTETAVERTGYIDAVSGSQTVSGVTEGLIPGDEAEPPLV